jgi:hypothetical protein
MALACKVHMERGIDDIAAQTEVLRSSSEPMWSRIRELLRQRGIEPATSALVQFFPDDTSFQYAILATNDGRLFQFGFDYLHRSEADGYFAEWRDCSVSPPVICSDAEIEAAFRVARGENRAR